MGARSCKPNDRAQGMCGVDTFSRLRISRSSRARCHGSSVPTVRSVLPAGYRGAFVARELATGAFVTSYSADSVRCGNRSCAHGVRSRVGVRFQYLAGEAVDQLAAASGATQRSHGDGTPVEGLGFRVAIGTAEYPAPRRPPPGCGARGFRFAVNRRDVLAVQCFAQPRGAHPTDTGMTTETIGCGRGD